MHPLQQALLDAIAEKDKASERIQKLEAARDAARAAADEISAELDETQRAFEKALASRAMGEGSAQEVSALREKLETLRSGCDEQVATRAELGEQIDTAKAALQPENLSVARANEDVQRVSIRRKERRAIELARELGTILTELVADKAQVAREYSRAGRPIEPFRFATLGDRHLRGVVDAGNPERDIRDLIAPRSLENGKSVTLRDVLALDLSEPTEPKPAEPKPAEPKPARARRAAAPELEAK